MGVNSKTGENEGILNGIKKFIGYGIVFGLIVTFTIFNFWKNLLMPIYRLFYAKRHAVFIRTPEEQFASIAGLGYPFTSKYLELPLGSGANDNLPR